MHFAESHPARCYSMFVAGADESPDELPGATVADFESYNDNVPAGRDPGGVHKPDAREPRLENPRCDQILLLNRRRELKRRTEVLA